MAQTYVAVVYENHNVSEHPSGANASRSDFDNPFRRETVNPVTLTQQDLYELGLDRRDLDFIDERLNFKNSTVKLLDGLIVAKMDLIRVVITHNLIYTFDCRNELIQPFLNRLKTDRRRQLPEIQSEFPFELVSLETIFVYLKEFFDREVESFRPRMIELNTYGFSRTHDQKEIPTSQNKYGYFVRLQMDLMSILSRVTDVATVFREYLELEDDDLDAFYLTRTFSSPDPIPIDRNQDIRRLFQTYKDHFEENEDDLERMLNRVKAEKELITIQLASQRNELAIYNLYISLINISLTISMIITGIFGMNLQSGREQSYPTFVGISLLIFGLPFLISSVFIPLIRRRLRWNTSRHT